MISICVVCKKELKRARGATVSQSVASLVLNGELIVSHGICYECGVQVYGAEMMATVSGGMNMTAEKAEGQRRDGRENQIELI